MRSLAVGAGLALTLIAVGWFGYGLWQDWQADAGESAAIADTESADGLDPVEDSEAADATGSEAVAVDETEKDAAGATEPVVDVSDGFAVAVQTDLDVAFVGLGSTVTQRSHGGPKSERTLTRGPTSLVRISGVWFGNMPEPVVSIPELQTPPPAPPRSSGFPPRFSGKPADWAADSRARAEEFKKRKEAEEEQVRQILENRPQRTVQLNMVHRAKDRIEFYCPTYQVSYTIVQHQTGSGPRLSCRSQIFRNPAESKVNGGSRGATGRTASELGRRMIFGMFLTAASSPFSGSWTTDTSALTWLDELPAAWPVVKEQLGNESREDQIAFLEQGVVQIAAKTKSGVQGGSGILLHSSGRIVTNYHVVQGAELIQVRYHNGEVLPAIGIVYTHEERDIVVLQAHMPKAWLPALKLSETKPQKGESVVAIGAPVGLQYTTGTGIVSSVREAGEIEELLSMSGKSGQWIQTSAPFSPGSDGGPLLNAAGEVVGMQTFALEQGQKLNFAVSLRFLLDDFAYSEKVKEINNSVRLGGTQIISPKNLPISVRQYN